MPTHRYWGFTVGCRLVSGTYNVAVAEMELRATVSGADLCTGGTAGADSFDAPFTHNNLVDNDNSTFWARSGGSSWRIWYDFGSPVTVAEGWLRLPGAAAARPGSVYGPEWVRLEGANSLDAWRGYSTLYLPTVADDGQYALALTGGSPVSVAQGLARLVPGWPSGPVSARLGGPAYRADMMFGGPLRIADTVAIAGTPDVPVGRQVRLYDQASGLLMRETWSDPVTGAYAFENLRAGPCVAMALDHTLVHEPAALDGLLPAP